MNVISIAKNILLSVLISLFFIPLQAQVGQNAWELIRQNDFSAAKLVLTDLLKNDPTNEEALVGMIFIAETIQDYNLYKASVKSLLESDWNEAYFELFQHLYKNDPTLLLEKLKSEKLKSTHRLSYADSLLQQRKFKEYEMMLRQVIGDYDWSVIGPFTNIAGSGFLESTPIETTAFQASQTYINEEGMELKWLRRDLREPDGLVDLYEVLPAARQGMYYANTFLDFPETRQIQIRITRTTPMNIWLDDHLVFSNAQNIAYRWDSETVELTIPQGVHRLLVKCITLPEPGNNSPISLTFLDHYDQGDGFDNYNFSYGGGGSGSAQNRPPSRPVFGLRFTDLSGKVYTDLTSSFSNTYQPETFKTELKEKELISYFKAQIKANPKPLSNYYLLAKAFLLQGYTEAGEAYFYEQKEAHPEEVFFRFLLAKFYAKNNKGEKAEALISGLEEQKTPFFALLATELSRIDQEKSEADYLATLDKLLGVSPTNWSIISKYLAFYTKKGKTEEKKAFIEDFLRKYPNKKNRKRLEPYLKDDSYKPSSQIPMTDKKRDKQAKKAIKKMKKRFLVYDYTTAIYHYKRKNKTDQVIKLYNQLIERMPYDRYWYKQKAKFLFEKDRLDDALSALQAALQITEYDSDIHETIGDIYFEKGAKEKALAAYKKAKQIGQYENQYGNSRLDGKMEKIEAKVSLKEHFQSITFEEALADTLWKEKYADEESVILLYTIESALDEDNQIDYSQKMLIQIKNEAGAKYWTEANFGFLGTIDFVKVLKEDGREISPQRSWSYVVFKNLEPGDIIQIKASSKGNMTAELPGEMFHIVALSHEVPVDRSRLEVIVPKDLPLDFTCNRLDCQYEVVTKESFRHYTWNFNEIPKMERETAIPDDLDSFAWMMLSTMNDWSEVVQWYLRKTYLRLETNYQIESELLGIVNDQMTEEQIVESIYNYLTKEITYSHVSFLNSSYIPKKPSATISDEIGDCKDVASLMIAMLRRMGIEAHYVLVRSSNYTNQKPLPTILAFNHVIVGYVLSDGKMRYLDLTTDYYAHSVIPEFDNNSWALLIKEGETDVFRLPNDMLNAEKSKMEIKIQAKINADRSLGMEATTIGTGVLAGKLREMLNGVTTEEDRRKFIREYFGAGAFDNLLIPSFQFENLEDFSANLSMKLQLKAYNHIERVSSFYIVQIPLLQSISTQPTLFTQRRYNNLDLFALFELTPTTQDIELEISANYELMEMPENIKLDNEFGTYELSFERTTKGVNIKRNLTFKTRLVEHKDYATFKAFYLQLLDADRTKLALRKLGI